MQTENDVQDNIDRAISSESFYRLFAVLQIILDLSFRIFDV